LVGGTSFYFKSLLYENFLPKVDIDKKFRKKMEGKSAEELMEILKLKDFGRAQKIDKKNIPRIIRSIEIINSLGKFPENEEKIRSDLEIEFF
jgi:tRNA A37 N6-isopentenylltransferase MiaA